jgi:tetratricopeptide (TPR) repeat protein
MKARKPALVLVALATVAAAIGWGVTQHFRSVEAAPADTLLTEAPSSGPAVDQAEVTNRAIAFYETRIEGNPRAAADRANLAGLYLQRSRETGNYEDVLRAEQMARESLSSRVSSNSKAVRMLGASLLAQHRFTEALEVAQELVRIWPEDPAHRALLGELQMEVGDYDAARVTFGSLVGARDNLAVAPRLARWAEISGRPDEARHIFEAARDLAAYRSDLTAEQMAWYHFRLGDLALRHGELERAEEAFEAGLRTNPGDYRIISAMARLEAARGNWEKSIEYAEQAIATVLDPAMLALMSEVYAARGDAEKSAEYAKVMQVSLLSQSGAFHRAESQFLLDRAQRTAEISAQAAEEIRTRRDVYGYDLLAWALHKQGRHAEAKEAMAEALRMGTQDATLFYHAGMIERALGQRDAAKRYLKQALKVNPSFHPTHAPAARATLDSIRSEEPWRARLPF